MKIFITSLLFIFCCLGNAQENTAFSEVSFTAKDGVAINGVYQNRATKGNSPAIIFIHQGGSSKDEWLGNPLTYKLLEEGYAVLVYDIRHHGDSEKDDGVFGDLFNNPNRAPLDLLAAISFLQKQDNIDSKRIGIIGASIGANLACVAASSGKYKITSVVAMSPKTSAVKNLSGEKELKPLKNAFIIASRYEEDGKRATWAQELYNVTEENKKLETPESTEHGSSILIGNNELQSRIIDWFNKTLK